jgi:hypothetical protein
MQKNEPIDGKPNFWELIENIRASWHWPVAGGAVGLLASVFFLTSFPYQYVASAILQPAAIATIAPTVEPVVNTLERLKTVSFYSDEVVKTCETASAKKLTESVKVSIVRGTNLIAISYRGYSPANAEACTEKIVEHITELQTLIAAPLLKKLDEQRASTKKQIDDAERFLLQYENQLKSSSAFSESVFLMLKSDHLDNLRKLYREQGIGLSEPLTQPMKLMAPIYAPTEAVYPKIPATIFGGLIVGLTFGLVALFFYRSWHRYANLNLP